MAKKLGFALGAGGSRGVAHIGFIKAMEEAGIKPDFIAGCSMGSVVGSCYAFGMTADQMKEAIDKLKVTDIFDLAVNPITNGALLRAKKMQKKLQSYLEDCTFDQLKIPFMCVATDMLTGDLIELKGQHKVYECVAASSSIPGVFKPVKIDDAVLIDGGVKCRVPVKQVREMGADVVVAVDVLGQTRHDVRHYSILGVLFRAYDILDGELTKYKIKEDKPDLYLEPDMGNMLSYKFKDLELSYQSGYDIGKANADKIKQLIEN